MQSKRIGAAAAALLGVLFLLAAVLYFIDPASALPGFLPGHAAGDLTRHTKHGILAIALAAVCFVAARFAYGPSAGAEG